MKKMLFAAGSAVFLLAAQMTAYADSGFEQPENVTACITKDKARSIAQDYITEGSKFQFAEHKTGSYEVVYYNDALQEYYQVNVDSLNGDVHSYKSWLFRHKGSKNVSFNEEQAKQLVLDEYPDASDLEVSLDYKGEFKSYRVDFTSEDGKGTWEINPESGTIIGKCMEWE